METTEKETPQPKGAHPFQKPDVPEIDKPLRERKLPFTLATSKKPAVQTVKKSSDAPHPFLGTNKKRKFTLTFKMAIVLVAVGGLLFYFLRGDRGGVLITETDPGLVVTVNSRPAKLNKERNGYSIPLFAGEYRVTIQKPHYTSFTQNVKVSRGKTTTLRPAFAFQPPSQASEVASVDYMRPSLDGQTIFYLGDNKRTLYRMQVTDQVRIPLTNKPLSDVRDVQWSTEPTVALITRSDGVYLREIPLFDFRNQTLVKIGGTEIESPVWDPMDASRIAFAYQPSSGERSLVISDKRAANMERKADIAAIPNPKIVWSPQDSYIMLIGRSSDASRNNAWIYDTDEGVLRQITNGGNILDGSFSPDEGHLLLQSGVSTLNTADPKGTGMTALPVQGSVAKAAWMDTTTLLLPSPDNQLTKYSLDGNQTTIAYNFPGELTVEAMSYFPESKRLLFHTHTSIYTVNLEE